MEQNKHHGGPGSDPNNIPEQLRDHASSSSQPGPSPAYQRTPPTRLNVNAAPFQPQGESSTAINLGASTAMEPNTHGGDPSGSGSGSDPNNILGQLPDSPFSFSQPSRVGSPEYEGSAQILHVNEDPYQLPGQILSGNIWAWSFAPGTGPSAPMSFNAIQQLQPSGHGPPPGAAAIPPTSTINQFRAVLLSGPRHPGVLVTTEIVARVVELLDRGDQEVLGWAFDAATADAYMLMGTNTGHFVFAALLRACVHPWRNDLLYHIASEVASRGGSGLLMDVANDPPGEQSLLELIGALTPHPEQCSMVFRCLLDDGMMERWKGPNLLRDFFKLPPHYHSIFIQFANNNFIRLLSSGPGVGCLRACYTGTRYRCNNDLMILENIIVANTCAIAQGERSNRLLRDVLEHGSASAHTEVADRVLRLEGLVALSTHQFGHHVVRACFQLTGARRREEMLRRTLAAFRALDLDQLRVVVLNQYGSRVLRSLLLWGKRELPRKARILATRIRELPEEVQQDADAELMKVVRNAIW